MEKWNNCTEGQGHSEGSECNRMFVWMMFSESQNILLPNFVWWCSVLSQSVMQGFFFSFSLEGQGHHEGSSDQNMSLSAIFSELLTPWKPNFVWWYIIIRCIVLWKDWIAVMWSMSRSQKRLRIPVNVHLDSISSAAEPSVTKLGMVMQHHRPKCLARRLVCCLQVQGHSEGLFNQVWLFLPYLLNCWSFCNQI